MILKNHIINHLSPCLIKCSIKLQKGDILKKRLTKIKLLAMFVFIAIIIALYLNIKNHETNPAISKIRLNEVTHSIFYAPQYVALELGYFKNEGLDVELLSAEGSDKTMMAVLSNQADIGLLGASSVIDACKNSKDTPILFAGLTQRDGSFLVGRTPDFSWEKLENKQIIAGRKGGVPRMIFEYILSKKGLELGKNVWLIDNIQFSLMGVAFAKGIGDFVTLFEPTASNLVLSKNFYILAPLGKECEKTAYTCYCCLKSYSKAHPDVLGKFTRALYKAQMWINNHNSEEIVNVILPFFVDSDKNLLKKCVENYISADVWCKNPLITKEEIDLMEEIMISSNELKEKIDFEKIVEQSYAKEVLDS